MALIIFFELALAWYSFFQHAVTWLLRLYMMSIGKGMEFQMTSLLNWVQLDLMTFLSLRPPNQHRYGAFLTDNIYLVCQTLDIGHDLMFNLLQIINTPWMDFLQIIGLILYCSISFEVMFVFASTSNGCTLFSVNTYFYESLVLGFYITISMLNSSRNQVFFRQERGK